MSVAAVIAIAAMVRLGYAALGFPDYWGDSYHNWLIGRLTIENGWIPADYKGRHIVWEPLFRYLGAVAMGVTGRADLIPGRLLSLVAGSLTCGAVAALVTRLTGQRAWGTFAGLTLALLPWHIAYSWMNMPEATAGLLVVLVLLEIHVGRRTWTVPLLAAAAALTRHDASVVLALTAAWLAVTRRPRPAAAVLGGVALGLACWAVWAWQLTGEPLYWLSQRRAGSAADAAFWEAAGQRPRIGPWTLPLTLLDTFAPVLTLAAAAAAGWKAAAWRRGLTAGDRSLYLCLFLAFLPIIGGMQFWFFSYPDPRYLLAIVPVAACLTAMAVAHIPDPRRRWGVVRGHAAVLVLSLAVGIPSFALRPYALSRDRAAGEFLRGTPPAGGALWVDAPVSIYYSGIAPARFVSSDQLVWRAGAMLPGAVDSAYAAIAARDIRRIYWNVVPYNRVHVVWPQMAEGKVFDDRGYRFEPVFRYDAYRAPAGGWLWARVRARIEGRYGPAIVWSVTPVAAPHPS